MDIADCLVVVRVHNLDPVDPMVRIVGTGCWKGRLVHWVVQVGSLDFAVDLVQTEGIAD